MEKSEQGILNKELGKYIASRKKAKIHWFSKFRLRKSVKNEEDIPIEKINKIMDPRETTISKKPEIDLESKKENLSINYTPPEISYKAESLVFANHAVKRMQKDIQTLIEKRESIIERNKDALQIWKIAQSLLEHLPPKEQLSILNSNDFANFKKRIDLIK